jgi:uncharacterized protein
VIRWAIAAAVWLLAATPSAAAGPIIDVHMHAHAADRFGAPGPPSPATGRPSAATSDQALLDAARREMDRNNIVAAVAFSSRPMTDRWTAADPRFLGGAQIDVGLPMPDLAELRLAIKDGRVKMIGEVGAQYLGMRPMDAKLAPYFDLAEEFDLPVGVHTGISDPGTPYKCCPDFRAHLGNPLLLEELLVKRPKLRLYIQHAGYPYLDDTIALMSIYPQVYLDISAIDWIIPKDEFYRYLQALVRAGFGDRIMFGSDQMVWPESISLAVQRVQAAPFLSERQKRAIFHDNAARFFRIAPLKTEARR